MKKWFAGLIACLLLGLAACAEPEQQQGGAPTESPCGAVEPPEREKTPALVDKTVDAGRFSLDGFTVRQEIQTGSRADREICDDVAQLYERSPDIVYGTVETLGYWDETGVGFTLHDFVVEKVYKGDLKPGDKISVLASGGYCRLSKLLELRGERADSAYTEEEIRTTVYRSTDVGEPLVEQGGSYVLFLGEITDPPPFPKGAYCEICGFQGRFYYKDEDTLIRFTPENEPWFYWDEETNAPASQEFTLPELEAEIAACAQ